MVLALDWAALLALGAVLSDFSVDGPAGALVTALIAAVLPALEEVVGAEHMHRVLRHWLVELGHDDYRDGAQVTVAGGGGSPPASR